MINISNTYIIGVGDNVLNKIAKMLNKTQGLEPNQITYNQLFAFFIPLGTSTLLISISNMLLNRCLGYLPDAEFYISSFSIARTLMLLFMSPVTIIALTLTTFTQSIDTFKKVSKFGLITICILQAWFFLMAFTPIGRAILASLYNLDGALLDNAVLSQKAIVALPILFYVRNYFLGIAIKLRNIKFATLGSFLRTLLILACSFTMSSVMEMFRAEYIPAILLFMMIFVEMAVYVLGVVLNTKGKIMVHLRLSLERQNIYDENIKLEYKKIILFALPLILSYSMGQLLPSFSQSAMALGNNKEITLTIYSVSLSLLNIIGAFSFQIPQLVVNHDTFNPINKNIVRNFCFIIAFSMTAIILIISFTPLADYIFLNILKISINNLDIANLSIKFGILYPASMIFMAYKRGKLIKIQKTSLLMFERVIGTTISLSLFLIIPVIAWQFGAGAGILILSAANFATGVFTHIIFKISVKRSPSVLSRIP